MKIVLLSSASSIHTARWAVGLYRLGHEVHVITQHLVTESFDQGVHLHILPFRGVLGYFTMAPAVRKLLNEIKPDIVNAHYASGYGTTARIVGYHPWLLSIWGSDVYEFPYKSPLHKWLLKRNLASADAIASTSHCMAGQARSILPSLQKIHVTPFGIDMNSFKPGKVGTLFGSGCLVVGTVKALKEIYGIKYLIEAFSLVVKKYPDLHLRLLIVGEGELDSILKEQVKSLGLTGLVIFTGKVNHQDVPQYQNMLDISVSVSNSESFGVAVIEASACEKPVIVSNVGGLPEVVEDGVTGLVVPPRNPAAVADAIETLILDKELRSRMGELGRIRVSKLYDWDDNMQSMIEVYESLLENKKI